MTSMTACPAESTFGSKKLKRREKIKFSSQGSRKQDVRSYFVLLIPCKGTMVLDSIWGVDISIFLASNEFQMIFTKCIL